MTAAATTGPNSEPRPTSSTPATRRAPSCHTFFSNLRGQRSLLSRRGLAAEADSGLSDASLSRGDTGLWEQQHLRLNRDCAATVENPGSVVSQDAACFPMALRYPKCPFPGENSRIPARFVILIR